MREGGRKARVVGAALAALLLANGSWGQPPGSIPPVYTQRLSIPIRGDDLEQPRAVVADLSSGEILVADMLANRIVIFDEQGRFRYQIPGGSVFQSPVDLAVDPEGYLFVLSQVSPEVTLLDFDGRLLRKLPLTGLPEDVGSPRFVSLAISPVGDRLFLMDGDNDRLWITDRGGAVLGSVDTTVGRTPKEIEELRYGHVDVYGETVLLPIPNDGQVHLFDLEGRSKGTIGERGSAECQLSFPAAAALDDDGRVLILDLQRAMFMTWDLERGVCLSEHYGFGNAPGALYQPNDMALDATGRLYVSQGFEGRVQVYDGARPAPMMMAARPAAPEISEETLFADAEIGKTVAPPEPPAAAAPPPPPPVPTTVEPEPAPTPEPALPEPAVPEPAVPEPVVPEPAVPEPVVPEPTVPEPAPVAPAEEAPPPPPTSPQPPAPAAAAPTPAPAAQVESVSAGAEVGDSELAARLVAGARLSVERAPRYDPTYVELAYPGGDPPPDQGGAVDVVVRAFRHAGVDLQKVLQEDQREAPAAYRINEPDPSIDHRRIRNLVPLFERRAASLLSSATGDWAPGDVVFWDRNSDGLAGHLGIVTAERGPSGQPLVIHHHRPAPGFPGTPGADDVLFRWPIVGHYRWFGAAPAAPPRPAVAETGATASELARLLVKGARQSLDRAPRYDPAYVELAYPGGDPPRDRGGAVDLVVRAFRHAGVDLQQVLHEDLLAAPGTYPIQEPDPSIDHRRIRNLVTLFERRAASLSAAPGGDWAPGDVVFWDPNSHGAAGHVGLVSDQVGPSGHLLVVHHHRPSEEFAGTPSIDDVLFRWPVVGHYRWPQDGAGADRRHGE